MKLVFEYLISSYSLFEDPIKNYVIMTIVAYIAYLIAFEVVGYFYDLSLIDGWWIGHMLHWSIRFIVFVFVFYSVATMIKLYKWIKNIPMHMWFIVISMAIGLMILLLILKYIKKLLRKVQIKLE